VFYCDIEPTSKKVVPLAGEDYWYETDVCMELLTLLLPNSVSEVGLIGRRVFLLLNYIKKEKNVSGNTRNLFSVFMNDTSSIC
jgi:hypothetical protein